MTTPLPYGVLPSANMLHGPARANGTTADAVLALCRKAIRRGQLDGVRDLLRSMGFAWAEPTVSDLDLDVARVADAIDLDREETAPGAHVRGSMRTQLRVVKAPCSRCAEFSSIARPAVCRDCRSLSVDDRALFGRELAAGEAMAGMQASANEDGER